MWIIVFPVGRCRFLEENESGLRFRRNKIWRFTECTTPHNRPSAINCKISFAAAKKAQAWRRAVWSPGRVESAWLKVYHDSFFVITDAKRGLTGSNFDFSNDNANQQMLCFKILVSTVV